MWNELAKWFESEEASKVLDINDSNLYVKVIEKAASLNKEGILPMWADGDQILVSEKKYADIIYHGLDRALGEHWFHTGYYDPKEDIAEDCVDKYTGWYYVEIIA